MSDPADESNSATFFCESLSAPPNCVPPRWQKLIELQLTELLDFGLVDYSAQLHVVLMTKSDGLFDDSAEWLLPSGQEVVSRVIQNHVTKRIEVAMEAEASDEMIQSIAALPSRVFIHRHSGNRYEYHGIRLLWDLAHLESDSPYASSSSSLPISLPDQSRVSGSRFESKSKSDPTRHILLYFHTKGMVNGHTPKSLRTFQNLLLTNHVIRPWREILALFDRDSSLNKAGRCCSPLFSVGFGTTSSGFELPMYTNWWSRLWWIIVTTMRNGLVDYTQLLMVTPPRPIQKFCNDRNPVCPFGNEMDCMSMCQDSNPNRLKGIQFTPSNTSKCIKPWIPEWEETTHIFETAFHPFSTVLSPFVVHYIMFRSSYNNNRTRFLCYVALICPSLQSRGWDIEARSWCGQCRLPDELEVPTPPSTNSIQLHNEGARRKQAFEA